MHHRRWIGVCLALWAGGCEDDDRAYLSAPRLLALGAYSEISLGDACSGGGKFNPCSTENIEELTQVSIDDPDLLRLVPDEEVPAELYEPKPGRVFVQAIAEGKTKARLSARFSDGSTRRDKADIEVRALDALELAVTSCDTEATALTQVLPGSQVQFTLNMLGAGKPLSGYFANLASGQGVACSPGGCSWQVPLEGQSRVEITSRLLPSFRATLSSYGPDDVTKVSLVETRRRYVSGPGAPASAAYELRVKEGVPCESMPVDVESLDLDVCTGPQGERAWTSEYARYFSFQAVGTGSCQLALGAAGARRSVSRASIHLDVVSPFTLEHAEVPEQPCEQDGSRACVVGLSGMLACRDGVWVEAGLCDKGAGVCDLHPLGEKGCKSADGCPYCR